MSRISSPAPLSERASPYQGLTPFTPEDTPYFFGREQDTEIITANLIAERLTLLYGPSGVGKSSVLGAGVVHNLRERAQRESARGDPPEYLVVFFNDWRNEPVAALVQEIEKQLRAFAPPLPAETTLAAALRAWSEQTGAELLFIFDQFEEYFLYHENDKGDETFAAQFANVLKDADGRANFLLSFREDALAKMDFFKKRIPNLFKNYLRIKHLDDDAARRAILKPLEKYNADHPAAPPVTMEPALVHTILEQVQVGNVVLGETGRGTLTQNAHTTAIETPYLQLVLTRLWETERQAHSNTLSLKTLDDLGGAEAIVRAHLENTLAQLTPAQQEMAASVFDRLVTPSGTKIAYSLNDLAEYAEVTPAELQKVLSVLASGSNRILREERPPDQPTNPHYEIFHDVLARAVLAWRTLYTQKQEQYKQQARLEAERRTAQEKAAREEHARTNAEARASAEAQARREAEARTRAEARARAAAEQEAHAARRLRVAAIVLVIVAVLAIVAAVSAVDQGQKATIAGDSLQTRVLEQSTAEVKANQAAANARTAEAAANQSKHQSESRRLAIQSIINRPGESGKRDYWLSFLLAVEAAKSGDTQESRDNLYSLLSTFAHLQRIFWGHTASVSSVAFSPDGNLLASASVDKTIRLWNLLEGGQQIGELRGHTNAVTSLVFSPEGKILVTGSADNTIRLWDVTTQQPLGEPLTGHTGAVNALALSPDGKTLASASADNTIRLWDMAAQQPLGEPLKEHTDKVLSIAFSPGGKLLASASADKTVRLWDVTAQQPFRQLPTEDSETIRSVAFSPDGKLLATGGCVVSDNGFCIQGEIRLWDLTTMSSWGGPLKTGENALAVIFSPDGRTIAAGYLDQVIQFWDRTGSTYLPRGTRPDDSPSQQNADANKSKLKVNAGAVNALAFSQGGKTLASGSQDGLVMLWDTDPADPSLKEDLKSWIDTACRVVNRNLKRTEWEQSFKVKDSTATFDEYAKNPTCPLPVEVVSPTPFSPTLLPTSIPQATPTAMPTTISTTTNPATATLAPITGTVKDILNVRELPTATSGRIGKLKKGDVVTITGRNQDASWLQIYFPLGATTRGWVSTEYIETMGDLAQVPVSEATPSATLVAVVTQVASTKTPTKPQSLPTPAFQTRVANDGALMILIPAGKFPMGVFDSGDRSPIHDVNLDAYWIDQKEITNAQFQEFVNATGYWTQAENLGWGWVPDPDWLKRNGASWRSPEGGYTRFQDRLNNPVVQVSWNDANAYCQWAGKRLPTEAEWEKAARSTDGRVYPWGSVFDSKKANTNEGLGTGQKTMPVGSFPNGTSPYGVLDMAGNVWEWVSDWYVANYYINSPRENPTGPTTGQNHVLRGGAWVDNQALAQTTYRLQLEPIYSGAAVGFRCAQSQ